MGWWLFHTVILLHISLMIWKKRSLIDHIFILESGQYSHNCGPIQHLHHGCNLSSHIPLICNITVPDYSVRLPLSNDNPNRKESRAWYRVTNDDIYSYQNILNVSLHELRNNQIIFQCNDLNCRKTEHLNAIATVGTLRTVTYVTLHTTWRTPKEIKIDMSISPLKRLPTRWF